MAAERKDMMDHSFRRRALAEAARYGSDPWVFVRELLQNARDAGAGSVRLTVARDGERDRVVCRDDGCGMSQEHARRYLFALYASSKDGDHAQAGKFGIGFWAVLRFEPSSVVIRSRAAGRDPWEVSLDGALELATVGEARIEQGTEIVLERPASRDDVAERVFEAAYRYGRFLTRRDGSGEPLEVTVNGRAAGAELALPPPSAEFRGKGFRGVVGLGAEPEVELFAQGLFVRSAASLQDLQEAGMLRDDDTAEDALAELPSLAPRVLIDSSELDLLLARGDARFDRHLRRVLRAAEKALGQLIERQLQLLRPQPWYRPLWGALRDRLEPLWGWPLAAAGAAGAALGVILLGLLPAVEWAGAPWLGSLVEPAPTDARASMETAGEELDPRLEDGLLADAPPVEPAGSPFTDLGSGEAASGVGALVRSSAGSGFHQYFDLARSYDGPRSGGMTAEPTRLAMVYEPAGASAFFNALVIDELGPERWSTGRATEGLEPYPQDRCRSGCLAVSLLMSGREETIRIPVPTGHRLEADSVRLDGAPVAVFENAWGEAILTDLPPGARALTYRTGPAAWIAVPESLSADQGAPAELKSVARGLLEMPVDERVRAAVDYVAERVGYDRSPATDRSFARFMDRGASLVEAALATGAGDCDVQNGVLTTLLRLAEVDARLVLGYVGRHGNAAPGLHAWVEVAATDAEGIARWSVADASLTSDPELAGAGAPPPDPSFDVAGQVRLPEGRATDLLTPGTPVDRSVIWLAAALLAATAVVVVRRRGHPGAALGPRNEDDLAALLGGALRHPEAFAGLPAMFHGRFVPLLGGERAISLHRARRLADRNRLFRSSEGSGLARRAAERGVPVVDSATAEGRVLSLALGAIDLDHWSDQLDRAVESELCRYVNQHLDATGAPWRLREVPGLPEPWVEVALEDLRLGRRLVLLDLSHPEFAPVRGLLPSRPAAATFTLLDVLLHRLDLPEREQARVLAVLARSAVGEAAGVEAVTA